MNKATYGEKVKTIDPKKVAQWKKMQPRIGTMNWIAEQCFRSRAVIHNAINHGKATKSTEANIDKLFGL